MQIILSQQTWIPALRELAACKTLRKICHNAAKQITRRSFAFTSAKKDDWNSHDEFFNFSRGRFFVDGDRNLRERKLRFNMNALARVAAESVSATKCVSVKKYAEGMYSKAFLLTMDDGRKIIAKVPNPVAGIPHFTTASEVATMDFAGDILGMPVPKVHAWNSRAASDSVGAEYIIMEKVQGVPLCDVWDSMKLRQKLQILLTMTRYQKRCLNVSFSHYGSLYYAKDLHNAQKSYYEENGKRINSSQYAIGPSISRNWADAGRSTLDLYRGSWSSLERYMRDIGRREEAAVRSLSPPKQIAMFCGPGLYQPSSERKLVALDFYQRLVDFLMPDDQSIRMPHLWHNDLHGENIFVDPKDPGKITGIIDWQSCHISPLFSHNSDPAFLSYHGLEPETLSTPSEPNYTGLSKEERVMVKHEYIDLNVFIGWRQLMQVKNPALYRTIQYRKTALYSLIFLAQRIFEYGEAHFLSLLIDLRDTWSEAVTDTDKKFPFDFSDNEVDIIRRDGDGAIASTELVTEVKKQMGDLWPEKGFVENDKYDKAKFVLKEVKDGIMQKMVKNDTERKEFELLWPFDD